MASSSRGAPRSSVPGRRRFIDGLFASGWHGDPSEIAWVYEAAAALLFGARADRSDDDERRRVVSAYARALGVRAFQQIR